jgi:hypothetical protein
VRTVSTAFSSPFLAAGGLDPPSAAAVAPTPAPHSWCYLVNPSIVNLRSANFGSAILRSGPLNSVTEQVQPIIDQLMGRQALYEWTLLQLRQACLLREPLSSYAMFVRSRVQGGQIDLSKEESAHTASFLKSIDVRVTRLDPDSLASAYPMPPRICAAGIT